MRSIVSELGVAFVFAAVLLRLFMPAASDVLQTRNAVWSQPGDVTTTLEIESLRLYADKSGTITNARCSVNTAPTSSAVTVNFLKNGTTIFTTSANRPSIPAGSFTDISSTPDVTTYVADDYFRIDVVAEDSGDTATDLVCQLQTKEQSE